jgi:hypothetical protein
MTFKDMALSALGKGLRVCRLAPGDKRPLSAGWLKEATSSRMVVESWSAENPSYGCGAVVSGGDYWVVDVDCLGFLMDQCPHECMPVGGFQVKTGGGGRHFYFKGKGPWDGIKHVPNPDAARYKKPDGSECKSVIDIICEGGQVLVAGNMHPKTKRPYEVLKDGELAEASREFVGWLKSLLEARPKPPKAKAGARQDARAHDNAWETDKSFDPDAALAEAGLRYERKERDGKVFYNYHVLMGGCLTKGSLHVGDGGGNEHNNECSAFVFDPKTRQLWHKCQAGGCAFQGREGEDVALSALGLDPRDVYYLEGRVKARLRGLSMEEAEHIEWLWPGYLVANRLTMFVGESTQGKSPVTLDLIARITSGSGWPDGSENSMGPKSCILMAAEDNLNDTIIPRLALAGAELGRVKVLDVKKNVKMDEVSITPTLDEHIPLIRRAIDEAKDVVMIVVDPVQNYLGKLKMNDEGEMRRILQPLADMCHDLGVCCVLTGHLNKRTDAKSIADRIMGARAFLGVSRQIYFFDGDPDVADQHAHVMVPYRIKSRSLKYHTELAVFKKDGRESEQVLARFDGFSEVTSEDVGQGGTTKDKKQDDEAVKAIKEFLKDGQKTATDCLEMLCQMGVVCQAKGGSVNEKRLRDRAGAETVRVAKVWCWRLKAQDGDDLVDRQPRRQSDMDFGGDM